MSRDPYPPCTNGCNREGDMYRLCSPCWWRLPRPERRRRQRDFQREFDRVMRSEETARWLESLCRPEGPSPAGGGV